MQKIHTKENLTDVMIKHINIGQSSYGLRKQQSLMTSSGRIKESEATFTVVKIGGMGSCLPMCKMKILLPKEAAVLRLRQPPFA